MSKGQHLNPLDCPRCDRRMQFAGTKAFHEDPQWGMLGDLNNSFVHKERFDVYYCPHCGRVELFVEDVGGQFRPH